MRWTLILFAVLLLAACGRERVDVRADAPPPPQVVTVEKPVLQVVKERVYVPIDDQYTREIQHEELPLWQAPHERDQLRAKLRKANGDRAAVRAIEGTAVKGAKP